MWRRMTVQDRYPYLDRFRKLLENNAGEVAELQAIESSGDLMTQDPDQARGADEPSTQ